MSWQSDYVITLHANRVNDPDEVGDRQEVTISCTGAEPVFNLIGDSEGDPNGTLYNVVDRRVGVKVTCRPATVQANQDPELQDYGVIWHLMANVLAPPLGSDEIEWYIWIVSITRTAEDGADAIPRAWYNPTTGVSSDTWWENVFTFPCAVVLDGAVSAAPTFDKGIVTPEFVLLSAEPG